MRHALIYQDENGAWIAEVPSLPGCLSDGETREEAIENVKEAMSLWLETNHDLGRPLPPDYFNLSVVALTEP
ncbi:MAG: type II toxin-antitoxin system HicB family antitoxin [Phycisphaerales bacterium]